MTKHVVEPVEAYRALFWQVLSKLAADGYVVLPDEANSLIGLFHTGSWERLRENYEPERGRFRAYLAGAFYRFARREILRQKDRRVRLAYVAQLEAPGLESDPLDAAERREEREAYEAAMDRLDPLRRDVLRAFLASDRVSERDLAQQFRLSRHRVREELTDALGQITTELGHQRPGSPADDRVAESLWRHGRTVGDAAQRLGLTVADVRATRARIFRQLIALVRDRLPEDPSQEVMKMSDASGASMGARLPEDRPSEGVPRYNSSRESITNLLKDCLLRPKTGDLLDRVREHSREILAALEQAEESDFELSDAEVRLIEKNPEWLAEVYSALDPGDEKSEERSEVRRAIDELRADEAMTVADAFEHLMESLDPEFRDLGLWFHGTPRSTRQEVDLLLREQDGREASEHTRQLVTYGLTPLTVAAAARGIQLLADRVIDQAMSHPTGWPDHPVMGPLWAAVRDRMRGEPRPSVDLMLGPGEDVADAAIPYKMVVDQVRGTPGCPPDAAEPLLAWMTSIAETKPFFFPGYYAEVSPAGRVLHLAQELTKSPEDILQRWSRTLELAC